MPLAERMRPRTLSDVLGQTHLLGDAKLLRRAIEADRVPSLILWGPPGVGKTSLARVIADSTQAHFVALSAVLCGVADIRQLVKDAKDERDFKGKRTLVFVDEIHRFHKGQQDAFLPHVENGSVVLIGATTENPSFAVNSALLSRCKVMRLHALSESQLLVLLERALRDEVHGLGQYNLQATDDAMRAIAALAAGDARRALNALEAAAEYTRSAQSSNIDEPAVLAAEEHRPLLYDKAGDEHHFVASAFIKSMRGTDPDAAMYWMMRMLEAGDDPLFVLRRLIIFASEDIGNADPRALYVATSADSAFRRVGMPEGLYAIAQAVTYLACAPKSNAAYRALHRAKELIAQYGALPVPNKLRNASSSTARQEGYGVDYKYPHDYAGGIAVGERYLPEQLEHEQIYVPTDRGEEAKIKARLFALRTPR
jgi:putative ATPase